MKVQWWRILVLAFVFAAAVDPSSAQDTTPDPATVPDVHQFATSLGRDGFVLKSAEDDYKVQIGLLLQADGQFLVSDSNHQVVNTFSLRRLRFNTRGRLSRRFEFYINPDLGGGNLVILDAYADMIV